jgi:predicted transcriptional regulator of viral defense system
LIFSSKSINIALGGENMIKTTPMLMVEQKEFANPTAKIRQLVKAGELIPVVRGLYETDRSIPGYYLAPIIYGPSYLSFEFALAYHSLIPEMVYTYTSATFEKKKEKRYETPFGTFNYRDVPSEAYPYGVTLHIENGYSFQMASPEKAICDELYKISPLRNRRELEHLLFEDLRIDKDDFSRLDMNSLFEIATRYHTKNHKLLQTYVARRLKNGSNH